MNFSVAKGEICVLLGPSGAGKSTLLNIIGGINQADSGYISIHGDKLKELGENRLTQYRRKHLGYVFQLYNLIVLFFDFRRIRRIPLDEALKNAE